MKKNVNNNNALERFNEETPQVVQQRLQKYFSEDVDLRQGSLVGDLTRGNAEEFAYAYSLMNFVLRSAVLNPNMPSDILSLKAREYGITRYPAGKSKSVIRFVSDNERTIPAGTIVRTDGKSPEDVRFRLLEDLRLEEVEEETEEGEVSTYYAAEGIVESEEGGLHTNVRAGEIDTIVGDLSGVVDIYSYEDAEGGYDEQPDEELYEQILRVIQRPITSGNVYHYEKWATDVEGIRRVKVYPLWDGNGTVKVVVLASDGTSPTPEKLEEVRQHIENERPIGATVTVEGAQELPINIEGNLIIRPGYDIDKITEEYTNMLTMIFSDTAFKTDVVRYSRIAALALDVEGVVDWEDLTINDVTHNILLDDNEIAVVGEVDFDARYS